MEPRATSSHACSSGRCLHGCWIGEDGVKEEKVGSGGEDKVRIGEIRVGAGGLAFKESRVGRFRAVLDGLVLVRLTDRKVAHVNDVWTQNITRPTGQ